MFSPLMAAPYLRQLVCRGVKFLVQVSGHQHIVRVVACGVVALIKYHQSEDGEGAKDPLLHAIHKNLGS